MNVTLQLVEDFGRLLSDGASAYEYRLGHLDPYIDLSQTIVINFTGVRSANSSFVNALIGGAVEHHGETFLKKASFQGCSPAIRVLVESAICLGLEKHKDLHLA